MKSLVSSVGKKLQRRSPAVLTTSTVLYELALGTVDYTTPEGMSFTIFYLLGVAFVGWAVGPRAAVLVSGVSAGIMAFHERTPYETFSIGYGMVAWNASTRF